MFGRTNGEKNKSISRITLSFVLSMITFLNDDQQLRITVSDLINTIILEEKISNTTILNIEIPEKTYNDIISYYNLIQELFG